MKQALVLLFVLGVVHAEPTDVTRYAVTDDLELVMNVFTPDPQAFAGDRPAAIFYFGGGWRQGAPRQFFPFCDELVSRGMACFVPDYRVSSRQGTDGVDATEDARTALSWVLANAARYRIDAQRIYVGGGSAGGHLAAAVATIPANGLDVSNIAGMLLFNPAIDLTGGRGAASPRLQATFRNDAASYSPIEFVRAGLPPAWIVHGDADVVVPHSTVVDFCGRMHNAGNVCNLVTYPGAGHGFFNNGRAAYADVLEELLAFLQNELE